MSEELLGGPGQGKVMCGGVGWPLELPAGVDVSAGQGDRRAACCTQAALRMAADEFQDLAKRLRRHADALAEEKRKESAQREDPRCH